MPQHLLALNSGSASLAFAVFPASEGKAMLRGDLKSVGLDTGGHVTIVDADGQTLLDEERDFQEYDAAFRFALDWLAKHHREEVAAVAHRVVHGGPTRFEPEIVDDALLDELRRWEPLAPVHLPHNLRGVELAREAYPDAVQVACYDAHFHRTLPPVAYRLPLPRRFDHLRRVGFHGLSYTYVLQTLQREHPEVADGRVVLAHLGGGASMAAVRDGRCVETTMGLTPAGGLMMSTRTGDLDPGVVTHLARLEGLASDELDDLLQTKSGLYGVSDGRSASVRELLEVEDEDDRAADALSLYVYRARKHLGALTVVLGGLDALVFTGSVGAGAPALRTRLCDGFAFLDLHLDAERNASGEARISSDDSGVLVLHMPTDEEVVLAQHGRAFLNG